MNEPFQNTTTRDLYWVAIYLHTVSDLADDANLAPAVSRILRDYAEQATKLFCVAQCEADELAQGLSS